MCDVNLTLINHQTASLQCPVLFNAEAGCVHLWMHSL